MAITSSALAQTVDVTASLDPTDGYARAGAYVPVRLRAINRTGETIFDVRLSSSSPVDVLTAWHLAPGETAEKEVPVFYVGGNLGLTLEFRDLSKNVVWQASPAALSPRLVPEGVALVSLGPDDPEPEISWGRSVLRAESAYVVRQSPQAAKLSKRCGLMDASTIHVPGPRPVDLLSPEWRGPRVEAREMEQPETYRLLSWPAWPAEDRLRLWLWLGVFTLAVLATGVLLPRRRAAILAITLAFLATGATFVFWSFSGIHKPTVRCARVFCMEGNRPLGGVEHLVLLQPGERETVRWYMPNAGHAQFPLPVLAASEDLFRPLGTLYYGNEEYFESRAPRAFLHFFSWDDPPVDLRAEKGARPDLAAIAKRADVVAALFVEGDRATDAAGRSQTIEAWSVEWKSSADPDLAYAGRSLAWWDRSRREGDGPALLVWLRDPLPAGETESGNRTRLPAMGIYTSQ